ncbi:MAG: hypothetical protein ACFFG0_16755 [Candidatus Thorarchaeota archaeon]
MFLFNISNSNFLRAYNVGASINVIAISLNKKYFVTETDDVHSHLFNLTEYTPTWNYNTMDKVIRVDISYDANTFVVRGYDTDIFSDCNIYGQITLEIYLTIFFIF